MIQGEYPTRSFLGKRWRQKGGAEGGAGNAGIGIALRTNYLRRKIRWPEGGHGAETPANLHTEEGAY